MKRKQIIAVAGVVIFGAVLVVGLRHLRGSYEAESSTGEDTNTVVTVQTGKIQRATLHRYVEGYGIVEPAPPDADHPSASTRVAPPVAGILSEVKVWEGKQVKKGELLFQMDSRVADVALLFAKKTLERQEELLRMNNTSQKVVQEAQQQFDTAEAQLELLQVRSPLNGTITRIGARPGEPVDLTTSLAEIVDLTHLTVSADIPADEGRDLRSGQRVEILTTPPLRTSLSFVSPIVDGSNGTILVRAAAPADVPWRPGQVVQLRIVADEHTNCLVAPAASVVMDANNREVISLVTNDVATQLPVTTGFREGERVEVDGAALKEGDTVVTVGAYGLPNQTKVHAAQPGAE